ncbi:unnamed protein product, partial [Rotaria socialis]
MERESSKHAINIGTVGSLQTMAAN